MKASEIRNQTEVELQGTLDDLRREQFNLRMQQGTGQMFRSSQMKALRRDIARVKTIMNEKKQGNAG